MTKLELEKEISRLTGIERDKVCEVVEKFMSVVKESLSNGENVYLRKFGSFVVKRRAEKVARLIGENASCVVPAHNIPSFRPSKELAQGVKAASRAQ